VQNNALSPDFPRKTVGQNQFMLTDEETVAVINRVYPNGVDLDQVKQNPDYVTFANEIIVHVAEPQALVNTVLNALKPSKGRLPPASVVLRRIVTGEVKDVFRPATPVDIFSTAGQVALSAPRLHPEFNRELSDLKIQR
jgi:hypothetical protein